MRRMGAANQLSALAAAREQAARGRVTAGPREAAIGFVLLLIVVLVSVGFSFKDLASQWGAFPSPSKLANGTPAYLSYRSTSSASGTQNSGSRHSALVWPITDHAGDSKRSEVELYDSDKESDLGEEMEDMSEPEYFLRELEMIRSDTSLAGEGEQVELGEGTDSELEEPAEEDNTVEQSTIKSDPEVAGDAENLTVLGTGLDDAGEAGSESRKMAELSKSMKEGTIDLHKGNLGNAGDGDTAKASGTKGRAEVLQSGQMPNQSDSGHGLTGREGEAQKDKEEDKKHDDPRQKASFHRLGSDWLKSTTGSLNWHRDELSPGSERQSNGSGKGLRPTDARSRLHGNTGNRSAGKETQKADVCPDYFRFIWEDLRPWRERGGIKKGNIAYARQGASFHVQIIAGEVFVEHFGWCYQTRAAFTVWGILQLLRRYPGRVPDVDLMFHCMDTPLVKRSRFHNHTLPPLLLKYCSSPQHMDVVWPDWSFWGWPEVNIDQWDKTHSKIVKGTGSIPWEDRIPLGQWRGAVWVAPHIRGPIVWCDNGGDHRWRVEASDTNWIKEKDRNDTRLENQCKYRYKIYVEGTSWSCSLKYIMACAATPLLVRPHFFDFFSRALRNHTHYLMVPRPQEAPICSSFKNTIDWAEDHPEEAKRIAQAAAMFVDKNLTMGLVYDYMLHFLMEYGRLQTFQPIRAPTARKTTIGSVYQDAAEWVRPYLELADEATGEHCEML